MWWDPAVVCVLILAIFPFLPLRLHRRVVRIHTGSAPRGRVVDLGHGVHGLKGAGKVPGNNGHCMAGRLKEEGAAEADDAGSVMDVSGDSMWEEETEWNLPDDDDVLRHCTIVSWWFFDFGLLAKIE